MAKKRANLTASQRLQLGRDLLRAYASMRARRDISSVLGKSFGGKRALYDELGYPYNITFEDMQAKYERQDIAGRVVDLPAQDTWRSPPQVVDGGPDGVTDTPFVKELESLARRLRLWHFMERVDRLAGIGRYGVLLIGVKGEANLEEPMGQLTGPDGVIFLAAYDEMDAPIEELGTDAADPRFGLPLTYRINVSATPEGQAQTRRVHWTRVIHVADDALKDEVYGRPRLRRVYNRLLDLEKIVGGSSEAIWRLVYQGLILQTREGYTTAGGEAGEPTVTDAELDEFIHGMRRVLQLEGMEAQFMGGQVVDPSGMFSVLIGLIAGETGIPQRILIGSERGELASSTDAATWAGAIESRRSSFAEPIMLRPFIDRLIEHGGLVRPSRGEYSFRWEPLFTLTEPEQVQLADAVASALQKVAPPGMVDALIDPTEYVRIYLPKLTDGLVRQEKLLEEEAAELEETEDTLELFEAARQRAREGMVK